MISDEIIIKELMKFKKPEIDELILQIKSKVSKLPSDSQLQKFKSIVLNRTIDDISDYLDKREKSYKGDFHLWVCDTDLKVIADLY